MRKGPKPLALAEKQKRGTVRPGRERARPVKRRRSGAAPTSCVQPRNFPAIADGYVADVLEGRIVSCRWTKLACERFRRMRLDTSSRFTFSPAHVQDVCTFIERLPHVEGRWKSPTITLEPWQVFLFAACYGFRKPDGSRLVTTVFFEVARKSAKSIMVAAAALFHLAVEREPGGQVITAATTGAQARIVFSIMQRMIRRSLWLRELGFLAYANGITLDATGGSARPVNSKSQTLDGLNPSFLSLDESHAQDFSLYDVLSSAQGARLNPMNWLPTTAGYDLTSVGFALRSTAMKVLEQTTTADHLFVALYELDEGDDWRDEHVWIKAAPMVGITPSLEYLRRYRDDAIATPGLQGEFEVKICNRWLHAANRWLSIDAWQRCADEDLNPHDFEHEPCWIGVDLAERDDIAAVALLFKREDVIYVFVRGYLPALVVAERARAIPEYRRWVETGELVVTDGNMTSYPDIEADLRADCDRFDVRAMVVERFGALQLAANLAASGLPATIETKNAKTFTVPSKELEARLKARQLRHTGSSFLQWQVSNVCLDRRRDGSLLPCKESPMSPNKIDGIDALLLALGALLASPAAQPEPTLYFLEA